MVYSCNCYCYKPFYFNKSLQGSNFSAGVDNWWFKVASSPNEFVLVEMDKKKNDGACGFGIL